MKALRVLSINGGRMTAFVDPQSLIARPLELRSAGDRLFLYWRYLLQEMRLFDSVVGFAAIRTVRMLRRRLGQNIL